jgi:hypothetical protein
MAAVLGLGTLLWFKIDASKALTVGESFAAVPVPAAG